VRQPHFGAYLQQRVAAEPLTLRVTRGDLEQVLSIQAVPYGDNKKLLLCRDVTQLERVETMRRDFVANVSHEIRTPLTVLIGFLETLLDMKKSDPDMTRRSLQLMSKQATRMQGLVEDLLTLSKLESAHNPLREEQVDVPGMLKAIYQEASNLSSGKHRISLKIGNEEGLLGSSEELRSAFTNLITNALRYTPEGGEIAIGWEKQDGKAIFSVRDSGIGIDAKDIPRLTERFYRVDRSRSRASGGTGLGLAIVKHVLNRHQAQLQIHSTLGRGSQFSAVFPAARSIALNTHAEDKAEVVGVVES
jgi:two-component system, OmpR family, phosphate regulon sensor histidine kinase PhoR